MEQELYQMEDLTSPWAVILGDALAGYSGKARLALIYYQSIGMRNLDNNEMVSKKDEANEMLREFQQSANSYVEASPTALLKSKSITDKKFRSSHEGHLQEAVKRELSRGFLKQLSAVKGPQAREKFILENGKQLQGLMKRADEHIHNHLEEYCQSTEAFIEASFGGALKDFNRSMLKLKAKSNTNKQPVMQNPTTEKKKEKVLS